MAILTHPPEIPINVASIVDAHIDRLAVIDKELHGKTPDHSNLKSLRQVIAGSEFIARNLETTKDLLRDIQASVAPLSGMPACISGNAQCLTHGSICLNLVVAHALYMAAVIVIGL